jgi:hypothetical protein
LMQRRMLAADDPSCASANPRKIKAFGSDIGSELRPRRHANKPKHLWMGSRDDGVDPACHRGNGVYFGLKSITYDRLMEFERLQVAGAQTTASCEPKHHPAGVKRRPSAARQFPSARQDKNVRRLPTSLKSRDAIREAQSAERPNYFGKASLLSSATRAS